MCPYARFQSAMFDRDTLIVSYNAARGEPRGPRTRQTDLAQKGLGACLDCDLCVQVCPTGIDIRQGLQYECIGCGACADVCDTVMDKMGYARGLVVYTTQNALQQGWPRTRMWRRVLRPRVLAYTALLLGLVFALMYSLIERVPLKVDVVRDRGILARRLLHGHIENVYRLQIMNATEQTQHFRITVEGMPGLTVWPDDSVDVGPAQSRWVPLRVQLATEGEPPMGAHPIHFLIAGTEPGLRVREKSVFLVPH
jgi:cytochrome c oxidase accessory protein FixG